MANNNPGKHACPSEQHLLDSLLCSDLAAFVEKAFETVVPGATYVHGWHIEYLSQQLRQCIDGDITRPIINMPPRHMKSIMASIALPAFLLGLDPTTRIICVSYSRDLAIKFSRQCRELMQQPWYRRIFPDTRLAPGKNTEHEFETTRGGGRLATSVGGTLTGRGGDVIIVDDPLKADEAASKARRQDVNEWFDTSLYSRLDNKQTGRILIISQRLHQDDLPGHLLSKANANWTVVNLPAICQQDQTLKWGNRPHQVHQLKQGEALWPEREPVTVLEDIKATVGTAVFNAQYLQEPVAPQGNLMRREWIQHYDDVPLRNGADPANAHIPPAYIMQSWDTASKADQMNDYSVCTTWYCFMGKVYLLDVFRQRLEFPDLKRRVVEMAGRTYTQKSTPVSHVLIEDAGAGTQLIQMLRHEGHSISLIPFNPQGDKEFRFSAATVWFETGRVLLPRSASWLDDYVTELLAFPDGKFDDQVDSTSQMFIRLNKQGVSQSKILNAY